LFRRGDGLQVLIITRLFIFLKWQTAGFNLVSSRAVWRINKKTIIELENLSERGLIKDEVWFIPGMQFMISINLGFFTAAVYGDLISLLTKFHL
jgi:prepilin signal peptidase PulO-like enzyme (type II secretory pathway)